MSAAETTNPHQKGKGYGALGFAGCLLFVLVLIVLGARGEITQSWGLAGEPGTFTATSCGRHIQPDGQTTRAMCDGTFAPASGEASYDALLYYDGDPGETYEGRADGGVVYRTDWAARWSAVALPLIPMGLLLLVPGVWLALRREGPLTRGQKWAFLVFSLLPASLVVLVGGVGFLIALVTT